MSKTLAMKFGLASGGKRTISVSDVKDDLNAETVTGCMNAIVGAGTAFDDALTGALKAEVTERTTTVLLDNE